MRHRSVISWFVAAAAAGSLLIRPPLATAEDASEKAGYRAHIAAALAAYRLNEPGDARHWLNAAPASARGWEWSYLDALFDQSLRQTGEFGAVVRSLAIRPDGKLAAIGFASGPIVLWDLAENHKSAELPGHGDETFCVRFSPDGSRLATCGADRMARVWDWAAGKMLLEFKEHKFPVAALAFSADGSRIASASYYRDAATPIEGRVHLWDAATGAIERTLTGGRKPISSLAFGADGKSIAAGTWDSCSFIWRLDGDGLPRKFGRKPSPDNNMRVAAVSLSADGSLLAAASDDDVARVYRVSDKEVVATLTAHASDVNAAAFSPDGATLATGGDDGAIRLWNVADWTQRATLCGHSAPLIALTWAPDGTRLYSGAADRTVRSWDPAWCGYGGVRGRFANTNYSIGFSPDGRYLACSASDHTIGLVDSLTGEKTASWEAHPGGEVCTAAFSPDGTQIASCSWDKSVRIFSVQSHEEVAKWDLPAGVALVAWHPHEKLLAAALTDKTAVLLNAAGRNPLPERKEHGERHMPTSTQGAPKPGDRSVVRAFTGHEGRLLTVAFSPDGKRLATSSADKTIRVWNVETGAAIAVMTGHSAKVETCAFTPDGEHVVSGGDDGDVRIWNADTGSCIQTLAQCGDEIYRVAVSPDGQRIAAVGKHLYLLDPTQTHPVLKCKPLGDTLWSASWSPDGRRLAVTSWNGEFAVLDSQARRHAEDDAPARGD